VGAKNPAMAGTVNSWFKPSVTIRDFLTGFTHLGVTHHSVMVYGSIIDIVSDFVKIME